jgi:hypothetical protein
LEDRLQITSTANSYIFFYRLAWAEAERPKQRSIALYHKLFEIVRFAELGGAEQPIEIVWGMGLSRWIRNGIEIDLPLLERLAEIEIDERAGGDIKKTEQRKQLCSNRVPRSFTGQETEYSGGSTSHDKALLVLLEAHKGLKLALHGPQEVAPKVLAEL